MSVFRYLILGVFNIGGTLNSQGNKFANISKLTNISKPIVIGTLMKIKPSQEILNVKWQKNVKQR